MKYIYVAYKVCGIGNPSRFEPDPDESFTSMSRCKRWVLSQSSPYVISIERVSDLVRITKDTTK